jgi:ankyrin repeat protein
LNELLLKAVQKNGRAIVPLLKSGADPNYEDKYGNTALGLIASGFGTDERDYMIHELILYGANINKQNIAGDTALHHAVAANFITGILLLMTSGADPNIRNNKGDTPIQIAYRTNNTRIINTMAHRSEKISDFDS